MIRLRCRVENVPQPCDCIVVSGRGRHLAETSRPFMAVCPSDSPQFTIHETGPALQQRSENLIPVMARDGLIVTSSA